MKKILVIAACTFLALTASAQVNYTIQTACHPDDVKHYDTERLRSSFLMEKVMAPDEINLTYTLYDRLIFGGAMPVNKALVLVFFGRTDAKAEGPILWSPDTKSQLIGKYSDAGKGLRSEENLATEDEIVGWHN